MQQRLSTTTRTALNAICPYFTMFPLEYPLGILRRHRDQKPVVMDPFCGRGTTLYAARYLSLSGWGVDSSPVAVAIARAKLAYATFEEVMDLASTFAYGIRPKQIPRGRFFREAFNPTTLKQICSIREGLLTMPKETGASTILRAAMLGCLHGPKTKHRANAAYFSNQMPRSFASKPEYSVRYWSRHRMKPWQVDVLKTLARKVERVCASVTPTHNSFHQVVKGDARNRSSIPPDGRNFSVVITSPPYYGMRTYVPDQWLRNWFLGGPAQIQYTDHVQLSHDGPATFACSLAKVWKNVAASQVDRLDVYIRFGVIPSSSVNAKELLINSLEDSGERWQRIYTKEASSATAGKRQADQWKANSEPIVEYDFHVRRVN